MRAANGQQVVGVVAATFGARMDVVRMEKRGVPTTRNAATVVIPPQHRRANRGGMLCLARAPTWARTRAGGLSAT